MTTASSAALDLFHLQDEAPGMVFWHPKGWTLWQQVEQYMRKVTRTTATRSARPHDPRPHALGALGHWENYKEHMFTTESEKRDFAIKPMNCPGHVQIFNSISGAIASRCATVNSVSPPQRSPGALHGIMRVRAFTQDDGHIFCTPDQIERGHGVQPAGALGLQDFGFENILRLALRPKSESAPTRSGIVPKGRCEQRSRPALWRGPSFPATVRSTAPRSTTTSRTPGRTGPRHDAGRFHDAGAPRRGVRGRGQHAQDPGHAASGDRRIAGTLHRHPDRTLC